MTTTEREAPCTGPYEEAVDSARAALAESGLSVVDELDLGPWLGSPVRFRDRRGVRWVVEDGRGASGFVAVTSDRPRPVHLDEVVGVGGYRLLVGDSSPGGERIEACSLYRVVLAHLHRETPSLATVLRDGLARGLAPRPFVSNSDVARVLSHPDRDRVVVDLLSRDLEAGFASHAMAALSRPYAVETEHLAAASAALGDLSSGAPLEWVLRRLSPPSDAS